MPHDVFKPGEMAGPYEIEALIAAGGHAEVYRARSPAGTQVALKCLQESYRSSDHLRRRFIDEGRVLRALDFVHIVRFLDFGVTAEGVPWIAMELLQGCLLRDYLHDAGGHLEVERAFRFARQIAQAARAAHQVNVFHRDLKPENIMVTAGDVLKVFDFGIAKLRGWGNKTTLRTELCGTPLYMAPEQFEGEPTDGRTDIFAIGLILYEMLAGWNPFLGIDEVMPTQDQLRAAHHRPVRPLPEILPGLPPYLWAIVEQALQPVPEDRWQATEPFIEAIGRGLKRWIREHRPPTSELPPAPVPTPAPAITPPPPAVPAPAVQAPAPEPAQAQEAPRASHASLPFNVGRDSAFAGPFIPVPSTVPIELPGSGPTPAAPPTSPRPFVPVASTVPIEPPPARPSSPPRSPAILPGRVVFGPPPALPVGWESPPPISEQRIRGYHVSGIEGPASPRLATEPVSPPPATLQSAPQIHVPVRSSPPSAPAARWSPEGTRERGVPTCEEVPPPAVVPGPARAGAPAGVYMVMIPRWAVHLVAGLLIFWSVIGVLHLARDRLFTWLGAPGYGSAAPAGPPTATAAPATGREPQ